MLPDKDHVVRTCKASSAPGGKPTPASFAFRQNVDGSWTDTYLSVHWLEFLLPYEAELSEKFAKFREFLGAEHPFPVLKPGKTSVLAAIKVSDIHLGSAQGVATILRCIHEPEGQGDPHAGIHPNPGVEHWPSSGDSPAHLAIQQFLFQHICGIEATYLPAT